MEDILDKLMPAFVTAVSAWVLFAVNNFLTRKSDQHRLLLAKLEELHLQLQNTASSLDISKRSETSLQSPTFLIEIHNDLLVGLNRTQAIMILYFENYLPLLQTVRPKVMTLGEKLVLVTEGQMQLQEALEDVNHTVKLIYDFQTFLLEHKDEITRRHWWRYYLDKHVSYR